MRHSTELEEILRRLASAMAQDAPPWDRFLVVENADIHYAVSARTPARIPIACFKTAETYAPRFAEHVGRGFPWINLHAAGILDGALLVIVDLPSYTSNVPRSKVSVNFSGPALVDGKPQWNAHDRYSVTE